MYETLYHLGSWIYWWTTTYHGSHYNYDPTALETRTHKSAVGVRLQTCNEQTYIWCKQYSCIHCRGENYISIEYSFTLTRTPLLEPMINQLLTLQSISLQAGWTWHTPTRHRVRNQERLFCITLPCCCRHFCYKKVCLLHGRSLLSKQVVPSIYWCGLEPVVRRDCVFCIILPCQIAY